MGALPDDDASSGIHVRLAAFDAMLAHSSDVLLLLDTDATVQWVSPNALELFDVDPADMVGRYGFDVVHPDDRARVIAAFDALIASGDHVTLEFRVVIDGATRWVEDSLTNLLGHPEVGYVVGSVRDITERREAEVTMHIEATLLASAGQAITALDPDTTIRFWNDAAEQVYGWSPEEAIGRKTADIIPIAEGWEDAGRSARVAADEGRSWSGEVCIVAKDGRIVPVVFTSTPLFDRYGNHVATTAVSYDATEQHRNQEIAARLAAIVETSNDAIFSTDFNGRITTWNTGARVLFGYEEPEILGVYGNRLVVEAEAQWMADTYVKVRAGERVEGMITQARRRDGSTFHASVFLSPIRSATGEIVGISTIAHDVSEQVERERLVEASERRLADAQASAGLGSWEMNLETGEVHRSDELWRILGIDPDQIRAAGTDVEQGLDLARIHPDDRAVVHAAYGAMLEGERDVSCVHRVVRPDGTTRWVLLRTSDSEFHPPTVVAGTMLDITERHEAQLALAHQATHDPLSGLANRRLFLERLEQSLERSSTLRTGVIFIDLDDFKRVNDVFGHVDGDQLLRKVGQRITAAVDDRDIVGRLGGDEYGVACDDLHSYEDLAQRVAQIRAALEIPFRVGNETRHVRASIGMAISDHGVHAEALLRNADIAMYAAKHSGGNRAELFDDTLYTQARQRRELAASIDHALEQGQFHTVYQPEVSLCDESLFGFEALARWTHPERGPISPAEFIPAAEQSGAIVRLGHQVLRDACRTIAGWNQRFPGHFPVVAVNLSAVQLTDPLLANVVRDVITETGIAPAQLCLEVTETALMEFDLAVAAIDQLKTIGVAIAIDDFGTGYSSLSRLKRFPVDFLKIDMSFVAGLGRDPGDEAIVAAVIGLADSLGVRVIAEGIETQTQLERLRHLGCELGQGYLWSRPLPEAEAAEHIARIAPLPHQVA